MPSSNSDTKEHVFDMPISLNYGSTGRSPGKFHLHHSFKEITDNLEFPSPPIDIFFIETTNNNNNNNICYHNNGGTQTTINYNTSTYAGNKEADTTHSIHCTDKVDKKWFDLLFNNNNNINIYINSFQAIRVFVGIFYAYKMRDKKNSNLYSTNGQRRKLLNQ
jgi:hypothetical protein